MARVKFASPATILQTSSVVDCMKLVQHKMNVFKQAAYGGSVAPLWICCIFFESAGIVEKNCFGNCSLHVHQGRHKPGQHNVGLSSAFTKLVFFPIQCDAAALDRCNDASQAATLIFFDIPQDLSFVYLACSLVIRIFS